MADTQTILKDLNKAPGIHQSLVVGRDGFVIENAGDMDSDSVGAIISTALGAIEAMGRDCEQGNLFEVMAEYNNGVIIAHDLETASEIVKASADDASAVPRDERMKQLVLYSISKPFFDLVHPDDLAATQQEIEKLSQGIPTISFVNRFRCADGSWKWLRWTSYPEPESGLLYAIAREIEGPQDA